MWRLLLPLVAALAAVAIAAGTAAAGNNQNNNVSNQTAAESFCAPTAGGTFVTSDEEIQAGLDYAVAHGGKIYVIEILPDGFAGVNEPGESLAQMLADGNNEDRLFLNNPDPHGRFGTSSVSITKGACAVFVAPTATNAYCYSKWQVDPAWAPQPVAISYYASGNWMPWAIKAPVSKTGIGNGYYLTCNLPAGYSQGSLAVGGGGQEVVLETLLQNPNDYYHNATK